MRVSLVCFVLSGTLLVSAPAWAAPGDLLFIQGNEVNIRQQPSTTAPVIMQLDRGHQLFELQRQGDWVNVGIDGTGGRDGWVHTSLIGPGDPDSAAESAPGAASSEPDDPRVSKFRQDVLALNAKAYQASGNNHFTGVSDLGDGIVRVTATEAWVSEAQADRQGDMDALFDLWDAAEGTGLPIMVQVVDREGHVVMTRARR